MAQVVNAFIYGINGKAFNIYGGVEYSFPVQSSVFITLTPTVELYSITMNSKIKLIDSGGYFSSPEFYTDKSVSDLTNEANS